ncbi:hypothetical protein NECID01_0002 [Nematocida sp. AWRm77]|nr:hypothetical protein NECID01_0002 [Nematocida sp. AWRm77]
MNCPPLFYEESIPHPGGEIAVKVFVDRELSITHVFAVQKGLADSYSRRLASSLGSSVKTRKLEVLCYLSSSDSFYPAASAVLGCLNRFKA